AILRFASAGSYSLRSAIRRTPLRCAGQAERTGRQPPLRFGWLLLAALRNPSNAAAGRRPSRTHRSPASASLRLAPTRFARQSVERRCGAPAKPNAPVAILRFASAGSYSLRSAIRRTPLRCAGQAERTGRHPPLRFGWLLLASLGNPSNAAAVRRPSRTHRSPSSPSLRLAPTRCPPQSVERRGGAPAKPNAPVASLRFASAGSYSLRSAI